MPAFFILVILGAAFLWLCCSFVFVPLGKFVARLLTDAKEAMSKEDQINDSDNKKENV